MTAATDLKLEVTKTLAHPPEKVFDAWLDPAMLAKFMTPGPNMSVGKTHTDPKVGGEFLITMIAPEMGELAHTGKYLEIDRANKLAFTWVSFNSQEDSTVTLTFTPKDGGTELKLEHLRFPSEKSRDDHLGGWTHILETLAAAF